MQMMNNFGNQNRGFGGPPQPQRQGGRRGSRGGGVGFRGNSRFDSNQNNFNQGGQRPASEQPGKPQQQPNQQPQQQQKPQQPPQQPPQQQQQKPQQSPQNQQQKPPQAAPQNKPDNQTAQNTQQPPKQTPPKPNPEIKPESKDNVDKAAPEQKNQNQPIKPLFPQGQQFQHGNQQQGNQQQSQNGNFGNKPQGQGSWGQGNKQGGNFGPNRQQGPGNRPFNRQGGPGQGGPGGPGGPGGQGGPGGPARNMQNNKRGPPGQDGMKSGQREEQMLQHKLGDLRGPLIDLPPIDTSEVKFNGRSRLYIGNLTSDVTEEEILKMFGAFGETAELFLNKEKNFGFIKMDLRVNAERAKCELDGKMRNGRPLRIRFAPHNSAVRVRNLPPFVSNELLYRAFEIFGKIERAYVKVDERGRSLGEGVVEYLRKPSALAAIRNCTERCFFLTTSLRPVIVEGFEEPDEVDGYPEKNLPKKHPEFLKAREHGPRFSEAGSFEHEYGTRWKQLHELHKQKEEALKKELAAEEEKLEAQMEYAKYEHETEMLREQLRQREQDRERQKRSWEMAERAADERREQEREQQQRQEEGLAARMRQQDDELRRRQQENTLFVQAQRLNNMLDRQEQGFDKQQPMDGGFRDQYDMPRGGFDDMQGGRWEGRSMDDYPNKRRRY